jgi:hypothetical protein
VQKTADKAIEMASSGVQPIEVVITVMRNAWAEKDYKTATQMAEVALPYTTPRLASTVVTHRDALDDLNVDELRALLAFAERPAWIASGTGEGEADAADTGKPH